MRPYLKWMRYALALMLAAILIAAELVVFVAILLYPQLPSIDELMHYNPQLPLRVYTADGTLIGEYGEERRAYVPLKDVPDKVRSAILAAEDARFYKHGAIDLLGILRASLKDLDSASPAQGASTITMQLVRNFYLNPEKTFIRKFSEMMLAYKVEHSLSKDRILEIYINQIYLGQRAYGFAAAADVYFGRDLRHLTIKQAAILAGLPRAPSRFNPIASPKLALDRAGYVLSRMHKLGYISSGQYREAMQEPLQLNRGKPRYRLDAAYVSEMVRQRMYEQYGEGAYTMGYRVFTTLRDVDQGQADIAVRNGVQAYDLRHGYRGAEGHVALSGNATQRKAAIRRALNETYAVNGLEPAVVLQAEPQMVTALIKGGRLLHLSGTGLDFARAALRASATARLKLRPGSLIRVRHDADGSWEIVQLPQVEAALVSLNPVNGAVLALCGGFDFSLNQFNHITQALRQPGSSFKPFIYSAALDQGYTPATLINDAPIVIPPSYPGGKAWAPLNYERNFLGPITLRYALAESRNVDAVRVIQKIGVPYARDFATRFGLPADQIPPYPSMVLGSGSFTPLQMAAAYAVFANGGYRITPYFVERILDARGNVVFQAQPAAAGKNAPQAIDPRNAFIMTSMLQDVVRYGTAARANALGRQDLAGKTGTTENFVDAWFDGYNPSRLAVAWMGFDQPRTLGKGEVGARAALPIWMEYMGSVLKNSPDLPYPMPPGVVAATINPANGLRVPDGQPGKLDYFYQENLPAVEGLALKKDESVHPAIEAHERQGQPGRASGRAQSAAPGAEPGQTGNPSRPARAHAGNASGIDAQSQQMLRFADDMLAGRNYLAASELARQVLEKYPGNALATAILKKARAAEK